jgi:hypothetical protein
LHNGATPRADHTKNKTDREDYNGCCPCRYRDSPVRLCVYFDETIRFPLQISDDAEDGC